MKIFTTILPVVVGVLVLFSLTILIKAAATAVELGSAGDFAVIAGSAITDSNPDAGIDIIGDVGLSPATGAAITGLTCAQVTGTIYDVDGGYTGGGCLITDAGLLTTAKEDLELAYIDANGQTPDTLIDDGDIGGGETLTPGVYSEDNTPDSLALTGNLILDGGGDPNAVFVFQTDSTLITSAGSEITLIGGAQACNVFWQVGSSVTLGTNSTFVGTIMAITSITDNGGSTVAGRLLADADDNGAGAVTLNDTEVSVPPCATSAELTVTKVVTNDDGGTSVVGDFDLLLDGVPITSGVSTTTSVGTFTVSETGPAGYAGTFTGDCAADGSITMTDGNSYACTLTNDDDAVAAAAELTVTKVVTNDDAGTSAAGDFTLLLDGMPITSGLATTSAVGTFTVSETGPAGYTGVFSGDCAADGTITMTDGNTYACTLTNDDEAEDAADEEEAEDARSGSSRRHYSTTTPRSISAPLLAPVVPGLPNTGLFPQGNN